MNRLSTTILAMALGLGLAASVKAGSLEDYKACMATCEARFVPPEGGGGRPCPDELGRMADDLQKFYEQLSVPRMCKGRFADACEKWRKETVEKLSALIPMLQNLQYCGEVDAPGLAPLLTPFDTSLTCKGDGVYSDLHDYIGSNREILEALLTLGSNYSYELTRFDGSRDYGERTPNCEGGSPSPVYIETLLGFYHSLSSLADVRTCASSCRKPSAALTRLEGTLGNIAALEKHIAALQAQLSKAEAARSEELLRQAMEVHPCAGFVNLGQTLNLNLGQLGALRKNAETQLSADPQAEVLTSIEQGLAAVQTFVTAVNIPEVASACQEADQQALALEDRKRTLVDRLARDPAIALEAVETFDRGKTDGQKCRWTLDCRLPGLCAKGKCSGGELASRLSEKFADLRRISGEILAVKIYGEAGLRPEAEAEIAALESEADTTVAFLQGRKWGEALAAWQASFVKSVEARSKVLKDQARSTLDELEQLDDDDAANPRKCRASLSRLRNLIKDFEALAGGLGELDPLGNSRWVSVQLGRVSSMVSRIEQVQTECQADCAEGGPDLKPLFWGAGALVLLLVLGLVTRQFLRSLRKYRPRKRPKRHHHHDHRD